MKILVPLDGSATAEAAVPVALNLARADNAGVVLMLVTSAHPKPEPAPVDAELVPIRSAEAYLDTVKRKLAADDPNVLTAVWRGVPAAAIIRAAQEYGADRIVMTTHGRSGVQREMFGSVADAVLRGCPIPVIVLRPRRDTASIPDGDAEPAVSPAR